MSEQATKPGAAELDANIDELFSQLEPGAGGGGSSSASVEAPVAPSFGAAAERRATQGAEAVAPSAPVNAEPESEPDAMLAEVAGEIERVAPAPSTPHVAAAPAPMSDPADVYSAFQAPSEDELRTFAAPPRGDSARPMGGVNIENLDAALAANADNALIAAQDDLAEMPEAAAPVVAAPVPAPKPAPAPVAAPAPKVEVHAAKPEPEPVFEKVHEEPAPASAVVVAKAPRDWGAMLAPLLAPLRPVAALTERLGESTRQTIAYCAILTLFSAACAWTLPHFMPKKSLEPATGEQPFIYNDTIPARGVKAPEHPAAEAKAPAHGESEGHGDAKKDAHAKPAKKEASGHGEEGHAEKKPASKKKAGKADAHAEH